MKKLIAIGGALVLLAAMPASASARGSGKMVTVIEHPITDTTTDIGKKGDSVGDLLTFANPIFNKADTKKVAHDQGVCVRVKAGAAYECTWTNFFPGGQIVVQGPYFDSRSSDLAIIGGTGKYATARGTMHLEAIKEGSEFRFTFRVR